MMERKYEIILYGATGFTGQICCKYLRDNYSDLTWAVAGRNKDKLEQVKSDYELECDVIVADGGDLESLKSLNMALIMCLMGQLATFSKPQV